MILVKLYGGLGNQLFQYALGRKLSLKFDVPLAFDTGSFENNKLRKFDLDHFNLKKTIAGRTKMAIFMAGESNIVQRLVYGLVGKLMRVAVIEEKHPGYDETVITHAKPHTYLKGYWQSEKYFTDIRELLLHDLNITSTLSGRNAEIAGHIRSVTSVSVHIRRGDYITDLATAAIHGQCTMDYYQRAIAFLSGKLGKFVLFVFSDDMPWAKANFKVDQETHYIEHNGTANNYEDLRLMSLCMHNIIANSSFSWWGAWMNQSPDKIVIAPWQWFADPERNNKTIDLVPETWIRI